MPEAATLDWLVRMRRLPAERMLDRAIAAGATEALDRLDVAPQCHAGLLAQRALQGLA